MKTLKRILTLPILLIMLLWDWAMNFTIKAWTFEEGKE